MTKACYRSFLAPSNFLATICPSFPRAYERGAAAMSFRFAMIAFVVSFLASTLHGGDWPCWRGPAHNGVSDEKGWVPWGEGGPRIAWKAQAGVGFSSMVVAGGRVFTVGYADDADTVLCLD